MPVSEAFWLAFWGALLTTLLTGVTHLFARKAKERAEKARREYQNELSDRLGNLIEQKAGFSQEFTPRAREHLLDWTAGEPAEPSAGPPDESIQEIVQARTDALEARLEEIEERFPADATLEKMSSKNDAILATKLEALEDRIIGLEETMPSKWEMAVVTFMVVGGIAAVTAMIVGILQLAVQSG